MKKLIALVLTLASCAALAVPALAAEFSDVPSSHSFRDAIMWCAAQNITGGYEDGTFRPANTVSRSNFTVMLSRAFYAEDVAKYSSYLEYGTFVPNYIALYNPGMLDGTSFCDREDFMDSANMNRGISRYDMAQLMVNIMNQKGFAASTSDKNSAISKITDYAEIPSQYKDAVANVYALGIISGYSDGSFSGSVTMNRGQAAIVIYRLAQYVGAGTDIVSAVPVGDDLTNMPTSPSNTQAEEKISTNAENGTLTLRDGSAVTEANVLKIINEILQVYPHGTTWNDNTSRNANIMIGGRQLGSVSAACNNTIKTSYFVNGTNMRPSMTAGCGGFASLVSDAIFGGGNTGGVNFPARKLDNLTEIRPGDILIKVDASGGIKHVSTAASTPTFYKNFNGVDVFQITQYEGNAADLVNYGTSTIFDTPIPNKGNFYYEAWTRYPD